jgi:hypothetical protein
MNNTSAAVYLAPFPVIDSVRLPLVVDVAVAVTGIVVVCVCRKDQVLQAVEFRRGIVEGCRIGGGNPYRQGVSILVVVG